MDGEQGWMEETVRWRRLDAENARLLGGDQAAENISETEEATVQADREYTENLGVCGPPQPNKYTCCSLFAGSSQPWGGGAEAVPPVTLCHQ